MPNIVACPPKQQHEEFTPGASGTCTLETAATLERYELGPSS
jgi:hypothetical protein